MGDLEALMERVKNMMGDLISKPKMSDKLLSKPPFRFLHDTISSIISTTGFGEGLYSGSELDSASIADKDAKIAYLNKIFQLVGICKVTTACDSFHALYRSLLYYRATYNRVDLLISGR